MLEQTATLAQTEPGQALVRSWMDPHTWAVDPGAAQERQQETLEVLGVLAKDGLWGPLRELPDPEPILTALDQGRVVDLDALAAVRRWLYAIDAWVSVPKDSLPGRLLKAIPTHLCDPTESLRILNRVVTPNGEMADTASPKIRVLKAEIEALKQRIQKQLDTTLRDYTQSGVLQDAFYDFRDGRYVVPVKVSLQSRIDGVVHGGSVSGQTVYIEPRAIESANRELGIKNNQWLEEVYRILKETSDALKPFAPELQTAVTLLARWDAIAARARVGQSYGGKSIEVSADGPRRQFLLTQSAHPALWRALRADAIVRNSIQLSEDRPCLMITGPNTGGKTVFLKTMGLAAICARTGFFFPGAGLEVPFFDRIFVDLGDQQSIERNLSSFSGHVLQLKAVLENLTPRSLILIDEMSTATDPEEGAALSRAFLETVLSPGAGRASVPMLVTTTHDPQLKTFALSDSRVRIVGMEFDEETWKPTYRLVDGIPGRSRALEIAERLGVPKSVMDLARTFLSKEHREFETKTSALEKIFQSAERERGQAIFARQEAERLKREWEEKVESSFQDALERARKRFQAIAQQAQDQIREILKSIQESRTRKSTDAGAEKIAAALRTAETEMAQALKTEAPEAAKHLESGGTGVTGPSDELAPTPGVRVKVPRYRSAGVIEEIQGRKVKVRLDTPDGKSLSTLALTIGIEDVIVLPRAEQKGPGVESGRTKLKIAGENESVAREIDLRGVRFEEAMLMLEAFLDRAVRAGQLEVTIVHGLGTGAIREGARAMLKTLPYVESVQDGGPGRGGAGATIVRFVTA